MTSRNSRLNQHYLAATWTHFPAFTTPTLWGSKVHCCSNIISLSQSAIPVSRQNDWIWNPPETKTHSEWHHHDEWCSLVLTNFTNQPSTLRKILFCSELSLLAEFSIWFTNDFQFESQGRNSFWFYFLLFLRGTPLWRPPAPSGGTTSNKCAEKVLKINSHPLR